MALDPLILRKPPIYLTTTAAAERMELLVETVRDLCERGVLRDAIQDHPRGPWRIPTLPLLIMLGRLRVTLIMVTPTTIETLLLL